MGEGWGRSRGHIRLDPPPRQPPQVKLNLQMGRSDFRRPDATSFDLGDPTAVLDAGHVHELSYTDGRDVSRIPRWAGHQPPCRGHCVRLTRKFVGRSDGTGTCEVHSGKLNVIRK